MVSDLQLKWVKYTNQGQSVNQYLDFYISGKPLWELLGIRSSIYVTPFGFFQNKEAELEALNEFRMQQKTFLHGNRIMLYTCNCCGCIYCGAVTARVSAIDNTIIWSSFADQSEVEEPNSFYSLSKIVFDRKQYLKAFQKL